LLNRGVVRLFDRAGREYARLTAPDELQAHPLGFSPDGTRLVVFGLKSQALQLWDLYALRASLRELGLDWDLRPYPPRPAPGPPPRLELLEPKR
jgi:hypothetical protein